MKLKEEIRNPQNKEGILVEVVECKPEKLEELLKRIETEIEKNQDIDDDYLVAKIIVTSKLYSMRNKR
jgi:hypothetical protein